MWQADRKTVLMQSYAAKPLKSPLYLPQACSLHYHSTGRLTRQLCSCLCILYSSSGKVHIRQTAGSMHTTA